MTIKNANKFKWKNKANTYVIIILIIDINCLYSDAIKLIGKIFNMSYIETRTIPKILNSKHKKLFNYFTALCLD